MRIASLFAIGALAASTAALADEQTFVAADADGSGTLSMEEVATAMPATTEEAFTQADADQDGALNIDEFTAALEAGVIGAS